MILFWKQKKLIQDHSNQQAWHQPRHTKQGIFKFKVPGNKHQLMQLIKDKQYTQEAKQKEKYNRCTVFFIIY